MRAKRLSLLKKATGEFRNHVPGELVTSSANQNWNSLVLCDFRMPAFLHDGPAPGIPDYSFGLFYSGSLAGEYSLQSDGWQAQEVCAGSICFLPPQHHINWHWWPIRNEQPLKLAIAHLSSDLVKKIAGEAFGLNPDRVEMKTSLISSDPLLQQLIFSIKSEVERGNPCGLLYGETAAEMMALHLLARHCTLKPGTGVYKDGLRPSRLRRTLEYIDIHLNRDISLHTLARLNGMSACHFPRMFKRSTGLSPLQYINRRRMQVGKELLHKTRLPVSEIALATGYSNTSHFISLFKRYYGVTPGAFRKMI
ncbi:MAG TPA: AraC family transcriptional regulator [Gammaproteobacteria bacterium]|nr:AraC family transcriptional regulator [Gammaproteobacteria bacterium]